MPHQAHRAVRTGRPQGGLRFSDLGDVTASTRAHLRHARPNITAERPRRAHGGDIELRSQWGLRPFQSGLPVENSGQGNGGGGLLRRNRHEESPIFADIVEDRTSFKQRLGDTGLECRASTYVDSHQFPVRAQKVQLPSIAARHRPPSGTRGDRYGCSEAIGFAICNFVGDCRGLTSPNPT